MEKKSHAIITNELSMIDWMAAHGCKQEDYLMVVSDLNDLSKGANIGHIYMEVNNHKIRFGLVNIHTRDKNYSMTYVYEFEGEKK